MMVVVVVVVVLEVVVVVVVVVIAAVVVAVVVVVGLLISPFLNFANTIEFVLTSHLHDSILYTHDSKI